MPGWLGGLHPNRIGAAEAQMAVGADERFQALQVDLSVALFTVPVDAGLDPLQRPVDVVPLLLRLIKREVAVHVHAGRLEHVVGHALPVLALFQQGQP